MSTTILEGNSNPHMTRSMLVSSSGGSGAFLKSSWGCGTSSSLPRVKSVIFRRTTCAIDAITGQPCLTEIPMNEIGEIALEPLKLSRQDSGRTKDVYLVGNNGFQTTVNMLSSHSLSS